MSIGLTHLQFIFTKRPFGYDSLIIFLIGSYRFFTSSEGAVAVIESYTLKF